ncbi:MAG TPA: DNA replication/repair protein RecF [Chloroflexota bacterium]|nr:DNA replication/repair protein RecF [Chloroflexota bacterium]
MLIRHLSLRHYRNYVALDVAFQPGLILLHGANAQGKTNLLEAIYLLATTKSSRTRTDSELISWAERDPLSPTAFARIVGQVERGGTEQSLEIVIREGGPEGQARKRFKLNGVERKASEVVGAVHAVFFSPSDVDLVAGSPSTRRRFLDVMLCQLDPGYFRALTRYNRVIVQRNALLRQIRERTQPANALAFWDDQVCEYGGLIVGQRAIATEKLGRIGAEWHFVLSGEQERMQVEYTPALGGVTAEGLAAGGALAAREALRRGLAAVHPRELAAAVSLVGPHRDDLAFKVNEVDATAFGSRGQQRTATLAMKLAELAYMRGQSGEQPILLLDDATSELDPPRRAAILKAAAEGQQTFVTSADGAGADQFVTAQRWEVSRGILRPLGR